MTNGARWYRIRNTMKDSAVRYCCMLYHFEASGQLDIVQPKKQSRKLWTRWAQTSSHRCVIAAQLASLAHTKSKCGNLIQLYEKSPNNGLTMHHFMLIQLSILFVCSTIRHVSAD
jgi:hypothetical protein